MRTDTMTDAQLEEAIEVSFSTFKDIETTGTRRRAHYQVAAETSDLLRMQRKINKKGL